MIEGGQQLNRSLILVEEMNLDTQPTQKQIFERADQLQIDDLAMARESLTKQMGPHWKPYCNRYQEIYYINLIQRQAYSDHPVDMHFKKLFANNNNLPPPQFKSFPVQDISNSVHIIDREIQKYKTGSVLNVVYEESEQQESEFSHSSKLSEADIQFSPEDIQELSQFQSEFAKQNRKWLAEYKRQRQDKLAAKQDTIEWEIEKKSQSRRVEIIEKFQKQIQIKNKLSIQKKTKDLKQQLYRKKLNMENLLDREIEERRSVQMSQANLIHSVKIRTVITKQVLIKNFKHHIGVDRTVAINHIVQQLQKQFQQKIASLSGDQSHYDKLLNQQYQKIEAYSRVCRTRNRRPIFIPLPDPNSASKRLEEMKFHQSLTQIRSDKLWQRTTQDTQKEPIYFASNENQCLPFKNFNKNFKPSLTLRLWRKIL